jgi:3-methyladenine DNA glycosylase AlkC
MAEPLKYLYNQSFVKGLTLVLKKYHATLDEKEFSKAVFDKSWEEKELKQRMRHIANMLYAFLPKDFKKASAILVKVITEIGEKESQGMNFGYMLFPDFIEQYGIDEYETSIKAFEEITKVTSAEFGVRPFLIKYPSKMQKQMLLWSKHKHPMVRRLSSEGFRPRLPWGMDVPYLKQDPTLVLAVLENLKQDDNEIVRRSVANNLNDIAKSHPEVVLSIAKKWNGIGEDTDKIIRHACRTLLKRGNPEALKLFGLVADKSISVNELRTEKKTIKLGTNLRFSFLLNVKKETKIRVEYGIAYRKANGKTSQKVFKISEGTLTKGIHRVEKKQAFKDFTTRKHYAGAHAVAIIVNGQEKASVTFTLKID